MVDAPKLDHSGLEKARNTIQGLPPGVQKHFEATGFEEAPRDLMDGVAESDGRPLHSLSSSCRGLLLIEGPMLDHREQNIESTTSQAHDSRVMAPPLGPFSVVIGLR